MDVVDRSGSRLGWCRGLPALDAVLTTGLLTLDTDDRQRLDRVAVEGL